MHFALAALWSGILCSLTVAAQTQYDVKSPECKYGFAISDVTVTSLKIDGTQATAVVGINYTPSALSVNGGPMSVCQGG